MAVNRTESRLRDRPVPPEIPMIAGCVMIPLGWLVFHQWGWILGGVMLFLLGVMSLKPVGEKEEGLQEEGEET